MPDSLAPRDPNKWANQTPDEVLKALVYELYTPVSALGHEVDRLATGAFADEELVELIEQIREGVNHLSRLVIALKRYTGEQNPSAQKPPE